MTPARAASRTSARGRRITPTIYLIRHAKAESRERWESGDLERPLTKRGLEQSRLISSHLADLDGRHPSRVLSSPAVRCRQTVAPLAAASDLEVVETAWLSEGSKPDYAFEQLRRLAARLDPPSGVGGPIAACTHGDIIWGILERLGMLGVEIGPQPDAPKGCVWTVASTSAGVISASFYQPEETRKERM